MHNLASQTVQSLVKFTNIINYANYLRGGNSESPVAAGDLPYWDAAALLAAAEGGCLIPSLDWHTRTLSRREEILPAIEEILRLLEAASYSTRESFAVRLSLEEALVNAIKHGHKDDPSKDVQLRYHVAADYLLVEIEDQGAGFKREDVPDPLAPENLERPCGRGLLLMQNFMSWVCFNDAGNCVTLCRRRLTA